MGFNNDLVKPKYWIHAIIISGVILLILQVWQGGDMFSIKNVAISTGLVALGDIIAHNILHFN